MADLSDVETALVNFIGGVVYPNGTSSPSAISVGGKNPGCLVQPGWPIPNPLEASLAAGNITVSVYEQPGLERNVSRYTREWTDQTKGVPTLTATVSGSTVTIGGAVTVGNYVSIVTGSTLGRAASYAPTSNDTLTSIAAGLAALLNLSVPATSSGPVVTVTNRNDLIARVAAPGTVMRELRRQQQRYAITIWAPSNEARSAAAKLIDTALAGLDFLQFPDTSYGRLIYETSSNVDRSATRGAMCRDLYYWVEYPTIEVQPGYPITIGASNIIVQDGSVGGKTFPTAA